MKTVVVGVFDDPSDARRVLRQLAASPLDLRGISVLHRDPEMQRAVMVEAGLPADRTMIMSAFIGAVLGAAIGAMADAALAMRAAESLAVPDQAGGPLGPVLAAAAGGLIGALAGAFFGVLSSPLRIPPGHQAVLAAALEAGATSVVVQVDSLPTARAISDLFRASGSRDLAPPLPEGAITSGDPAGSAAPVAGEDKAAGPMDEGQADALFRPRPADLPDSRQT
jgi:hypothetical protein